MKIAIHFLIVACAGEIPDIAAALVRVDILQLDRPNAVIRPELPVRGFVGRYAFAVARAPEAELVLPGLVEWHWLVVDIAPVIAGVVDDDVEDHVHAARVRFARQLL